MEAILHDYDFYESTIDDALTPDARKNKALLRGFFT